MTGMGRLSKAGACAEDAGRGGPENDDAHVLVEADGVDGLAQETDQVLAEAIPGLKRSRNGKSDLFARERYRLDRSISMGNGRIICSF